jgi:hypothetical protein
MIRSALTSLALVPCDVCLGEDANSLSASRIALGVYEVARPTAKGEDQGLGSGLAESRPAQLLRWAARVLSYWATAVGK